MFLQTSVGSAARARLFFASQQLEEKEINPALSEKFKLSPLFNYWELKAI